MPWVKLTDDWYDDPAIASLDDHGIALWVLGLSWCARNLTDGEIPGAMVRRLSSHEDPPSVAANLVELDLWSVIPAGYLVENYHEYQPTRADVLAKREAERERGRRRRGESSPTPAGVHADSAPDPDPPVPVPGSRSVVVVSEITHDLEPDAADNPGEEGTVSLSECWGHIARWKAEDQGKVGHSGWLRACKRNQPDDPHPDGGTFLDQAHRVLEAFEISSPLVLAEVLFGKRHLRNVPRRQAAS